MRHNPASGRRSAGAALFGITMTLGAACAEVSTQLTTRATPAVDVPSFTTPDPVTETLGALVNGPTRISTEGSYSYRATVSGGVGPYQYDWFQQYCSPIDGEAASCSELGMIQSGVGLDSIRIEYPTRISKMRLAVHVYDAQTHKYVGTGNITATNTLVAQQPATSLGCDFGQGFYPVADSTGKRYRRNSCTGAREYANSARPFGSTAVSARR